MRILVRIIVLLCTLLTPALAQRMDNSQFQLSFSRVGLGMLKRTQDVFDTNYILAGRTLGDVLVRYRVPAQAWREVASATSAERSASDAVSYKIGRAIPTIATASRTNSSVGPWGTRALNDQIEPANSHDKSIPFFAWGDHHGTSEWVEYQFENAVQVSSAEVYWAVGSYDDYKWDLPLSWKLQYRAGDQWQDVHTSNDYGLKLDAFNHVDFAPVTTQALRIVAQLPRNATSAIYEWRVNTNQGKQVELAPEIQPAASFRLQEDSLIWTIQIRNRTSTPLEIGDLGIPLPLNTDYVPDKTETYTKRLIRHSFIGGDGSYIFWMRCNGIGPYLLMIPQKETHFEYFDQADGHSFTAYIHSSARAAELRSKGGKWRLPDTSVTLAPKGTSGDSVQYAFKFRWAKDYAAVREVLYEEGGFDVNVVPGMTVPTDLPTMFSLRTRNRIREIAAEHPKETAVTLIAQKEEGTHIYSVRFSRLGENMLTVRYGNGEYLSLDFFVTEPLETMIKKRARFLVTHEQWNDPTRWYNGLYSQWDMKHEVLRSPDDLDGLQSYAVACDDPALGKAPYIAAKNVFFPDPGEITSLENYIQHYVWGGLQQTDKEPYPFGIYGIPNWKQNRESPFSDERGKKHLWRIYDYPHIILLYYEMYLVAHNYPGMVHYLDASGYLDRAYGTAIAFFTVPMEIVKWSAYETGTYDELIIPDLIHALEQADRKEEAEKLRAHWEAKAEFFINKQPDLFQSEYPFDSTGFESTHALAKYAIKRLQNPQATEFREAVKQADAEDFLQEQMRLNVAARGTEPAYYWLGSDYRASGNTTYTLSYMSQMGGWAVEDYALNFASDPTPYLRLGYASYLSSWALLNSGTPTSHYGYKPKIGSSLTTVAAVRSAPPKPRSISPEYHQEPRPISLFPSHARPHGRGSNPPPAPPSLLFPGNQYAYGGELRRRGRWVEVVPRDGLRDRFDIVRGSVHFQMRLDRDGLAQNQPVVFKDSLDQLSFRIENRSHDRHQTSLTVSGLPAGTYRVLLNASPLTRIAIRDDKETNLEVPVSANTLCVTITKD